MLLTFDCPDHLAHMLIDFAGTLGIQPLKAIPSIPGLNEAERIVLGTLGIDEIGELRNFAILDFWRAFTRGLSVDIQITDVARAMVHHDVRFRDAEPTIFLGQTLTDDCGISAPVCSVLRHANVPTIEFLRLLPMEDIRQIPNLGEKALKDIEAFKAR